MLCRVSQTRCLSRLTYAVLAVVAVGCSGDSEESVDVCNDVARYPVVVGITDAVTGEGVCSATIEVSNGAEVFEPVQADCLPGGNSETYVGVSGLQGADGADSSAGSTVSLVIEVRADGYESQQQQVAVPFDSCGPETQAVDFALQPG